MSKIEIAQPTFIHLSSCLERCVNLQLPDSVWLKRHSCKQAKIAGRSMRYQAEQCVNLLLSRSNTGLSGNSSRLTPIECLIQRCSDSYILPLHVTSLIAVKPWDLQIGKCGAPFRKCFGLRTPTATCSTPLFTSTRLLENLSIYVAGCGMTG